MPWRGLEWRFGFQVNFTKLLHGCCLPDERVYCACPLVFPATPARYACPLRWDAALELCACPMHWDVALARWPPLASTDNGETPFLYNAFSPENYNFHHNMSFPAQNAKRHPPKKMSLCADGETRTHTGQRPLPPQRSVSTISPRPQYFGTAKLRTKIKKQNFFEIFLCIFVELFRKTAKLRRQFIGTHCVTV